MTSPIINCNIDWLCDNESQINDYSPQSPETNYARARNPLPDGAGGGWVEVLELDRGMSISRATHTFDEEMHGKSITINRVNADLTEPALIVQSIRSGQVLVHDYTVNRKFTIDPNNNLFHFVDRLDFEPNVDCSIDVDVFVLKICQSTMIKLAGEHVFNNITSSLDITTTPSAAVSSVPQYISRTMHRSLSVNSMQGSLKQLYAESKILDYVCSLAECLTDMSETISGASKKKRIINELHDELTRLGGKLPRLSELANRYGMSSKTLNETFKQTYGEPIVSFITNHRLAEAHAALEESDIAIKVLASRLGYAHVNHFTTAFRKKFGYPPGQVRR